MSYVRQADCLRQQDILFSLQPVNLFVCGNSHIVKQAIQCSRRPKFVKLNCCKITNFTLSVLPQKQNPCFTGATDSNFPFWQIFFFVFPKSCKISHFFGTKIKKFQLKIFENNISQSKYFPKIFLQKMSDFFSEICVVLGSFLLPEMKIKWRIKRPTNRLYLAGPSAHKTFFFFFFCGLMV